MLPDVPWLRPDAFIHRHLAMIVSRNCRSSRVMSRYLSSSARIEWRLACEKPAHLLCRLIGGNGDGAHGGAGDVRCQRDVRELQERPVRRHRLDRKSIEHGTGEPAREKHVMKRVVIYQRTTRGVDENGAPLYPRQRVAIDKSGGLGRHPRMQADNVSTRQEVRERDMFDSIVAVLGAELHIGISHQDLAAERLEQ